MYQRQPASQTFLQDDLLISRCILSAREDARRTARILGRPVLLMCNSTAKPLHETLIERLVRGGLSHARRLHDGFIVIRLDSNDEATSIADRIQRAIADANLWDCGAALHIAAFDHCGRPFPVTLH